LAEAGEHTGDAVRFIDAVGFCLLFPVKNVALPSLYYAVARRIRLPGTNTP